VLQLSVRYFSEAQIFESSTITDNTFVASSFINDNEGWLADNNGMLFHTSNSGQTWDSISITKNFLKFDFVDAVYGFALASEGAYKTTDGGNTWSSLSLPGYIGESLYFLDNNTGFISGNKMIFKTTDGGTTWTTIYTEDVSFFDYYFTTSSAGIAVAHDDEYYKCVWKTTDGGLSWENVYNEKNFFMNAVWFSNESMGWAAGYYDQGGLKYPAIVSTTDGGLTWKNIYLNWQIDNQGEDLTDIRFRNENEGYAISKYAYDVYTTDGGVTWNLSHNTDDLGLSSFYGTYKTLDGFHTLFLLGKNGNVAIWK
ncbi:MAG: hypothetical protein LH473_03010, partial [Chitinophagales bacterium]|nr:hypothetical protein [Chitinophagales bacterium]